MMSDCSVKAMPSILTGRLGRLLRVGAGLAIGILAASGTTVLDVTSSISATDPIQLGRLIRDGIQSDWSDPKAFPGTNNPGVPFHYHAYSMPVGAERFFEITFNDLSLTAFDFVSAYADSYNPGVGFDLNYLGDAGFSGNYYNDHFGPIFFQIVAPPSVTDLVVVVNDATSSGSGIGAPFDLVVNSYLDTSYDSVPASVPEPSSRSLYCGGCLLLLIALARKDGGLPHAVRPRAIAVWLLLISLGSLPLLAQSAAGLSPAAIQQIKDILRDKRQILKTNPKVDLNLYFASKRAQGQLTNKSYSKSVTSPRRDSNGLVTVVIRGTLTSALRSKITSVGGTVIQYLPKFSYARVQVPLSVVESLSTISGVSHIGADEQATTNALVPSLRLSPGSHSRLGLSLALGQFFGRAGLNPFVGAVTSQGIVSHRANQVFSLGVAGAGVKVGVLSDSASPATVAALIATGDLPADVTIVPGEEGLITGNDEGAAMMEIIHDMAPGAKLYFATAFKNSISFAENIRTLRDTYGCDIIVDDVTYFAEAAFQDGPIAQAVNDVVASGALYFSSAANSGNLSRGTSGTWEGDFKNGGAVNGPVTDVDETGFFHNFGAVGIPQLFDTMIAPSSVISLKWSDPLGASINDYDLFILNSTGSTLKGFSASAQDGHNNPDPLEIIGQGDNCDTAAASGYCPAPGDRVVVVLFDGLPRALRLDTNRGLLSLATDGSTAGHNAGLNTVSIAAVYWNSAGKGAQPFIGGANNPIESFSSDGPRKIFFHPDGTPITPGNFLFATGGGRTLQKPDFAAADGVSAKTPGFLPFFGTSAAAPHAAAIAALLKSAKPGYSNTQIYHALRSTTIDNMELGVDRDSGYGILNAFAAVKYAESH